MSFDISELLTYDMLFSEWVSSPWMHYEAILFSSPSGWRDIGVLFVENRHLEMLLL